MKIRILGAGFYGCHIAAALKDEHDVEVWEIRDRIFGGASGGIPARLHIGCHYPRSRLTRAACLEHHAEFMGVYGHLTRGIPVNLYAIAENHSMVDFAQYVATLKGEIEFLTVNDPAEFGLKNVDGAIQVAERHIVTDRAREHFEKEIGHLVKFSRAPGEVNSADFDWTIDCTFCANDSAGVDRYEPCLVLLLEGATDKAVTVMDGPFGSLYPWNEEAGLCSLSSARWTPFSKTCRTWSEANDLLAALTPEQIDDQAQAMIESMAYFYPAVRGYEVVDYRLSIRAMPLSGADTRLVDVVKVGERALRVRAGKIDAILAAERQIRGMMCPS